MYTIACSAPVTICPASWSPVYPAPPRPTSECLISEKFLPPACQAWPATTPPCGGCTPSLPISPSPCASPLRPAWPCPVRPLLLLYLLELSPPRLFPKVGAIHLLVQPPLILHLLNLACLLPVAGVLSFHQPLPLLRVPLCRFKNSERYWKGPEIFIMEGDYRYGIGKRAPKRTFSEKI